ncbi:energy transducer TonB [Sphingomonas sp. QA11]|uniref:energy transducer TonB n=1 Tax=Sphingomonas sp. QA11 TaxID=2950605 RepID=UPI00234B4312|nr:energy transducer TonB [Sphingomonas sp. QA11]WCM24994.1 energy transducer TonB [Sphingomonas sp. QA11]
MNRFSCALYKGLAVTCSSTLMAGGQPVAAESGDGWKVFQRPYGCGISRSGTSDLSPDPVFWRPFRGKTTILLKIDIPKGEVATSGNAYGFVELDKIRRIPMHISWGSEIDPSKTDWPSKKLFSMKLEKDAERDFGHALTIANSGRVIVKNDQIAITLPDLAAWQQADGCLERVGSALLTSAPPPYRDGSRPDRNLPVPRGAGSWINSNAYPPKALENNMEGDVRITVIVDKYGYPLECNVTQGSGTNILDDATCPHIIRAAHFYPALNTVGIASDSKWETIIKWRVP